MAALEIVEAGIGTSLQDAGRPGFAHLGVTASGAVDPALMAVLNRLVGNPSGATVFETCGGLVIRAVRDVLVATSAEPVPHSLRPGDRCVVPGGAGGRLWHYVAVRGGVRVDPVLGSTSSDSLAGLGPAPCASGDRFDIGEVPTQPIVADFAPLVPVPDLIRVSTGPRADWVVDAMGVLTGGSWTVTASSRVGVRFEGPLLTRAVERELPSEGLVRGAVQVPPDGNPVMMLADHPTTGGYPVVAVVHPDDVAAVAQHPPGTRLRFRAVPG